MWGSLSQNYWQGLERSLIQPSYLEEGVKGSVQVLTLA